MVCARVYSVVYVVSSITTHLIIHVMVFIRIIYDFIIISHLYQILLKKGGAGG